MIRTTKKYNDDYGAGVDNCGPVILEIYVDNVDEDNDDDDDGDDGDHAHNCGRVIWGTASLPVNLRLPPPNLLQLTWTEYKEKQTTYILFYTI